LKLGISAVEYVNGIRNGDFTVEEFVGKTMEQISKYDGDLHAFLSINEKALDEARNIDKKINSGEHVGAFYGMPISIKDNICIKGFRTTCASKMLENYVSPYDATVIVKLREQDSIFV
jgi:aspartyl-tRNA(Asn)/glutamyl-tRNA(Gln) amidotransferase subunit A